MESRIDRLSEQIEGSGLDAYVVTKSPNIYYFTESISGGRLIVTPNEEPTLLVGRLNLTCAQDQAKGCGVKPYTRKEIINLMARELSGANPKNIGFDELSLSMYNDLKEKMPDVETKAAPEIVRSMRMVKDEDEINLMRRAAVLADIGMDAIKDCLRIGIRENEVAAEAAYAMRKEGADALAFPFIVASGPRSAYPHGGVTDRKIKMGEFVTIDMGAGYKEYKTDITRTFIVGPPTERQAEIYETVLSANLSALQKIRERVPGSEVHAEAERIIGEAHYGEYFIHGLGHGVGLEVHEGPSLGKSSKDILEIGNVVTNEPGIYIPGYGGVRIEDTVLVTSSDPVCLTKTPKDLDAMCV